MGNKVLHKKSNRIVNGGPLLPISSEIDTGEIAINYAAGNEVMAIKNSDGEIVQFTRDRSVGAQKTNNYEHAEGSFNKSNHSSDVFGDSGNTIHSVGIGVSSADRKNAIEIMQNGDIYIYGFGGYSGDTIASADTIQKYFEENEMTIAAAINELNSRIENVDVEVPTASTSNYGLVKIGSFLNVNNGVISVKTGTTSTSIAVGNHTHSQMVTGVTVNGNNASVSDGNASVTISNVLPSVVAGDNYKVMQVVNGSWTLTTPVMIYSGSATPTIATGNNGDLYFQTADVQREPDVVYETDGTTGLLGHNNNTYENNWQLEDLDLTPYKYIKCYFRASQTTSASDYTTAVVVTVQLDEASKGPTIYMGSTMTPLPFNRNREYLVSCAVDSTKTKFQVVHQNTLWDITASDANDTGRYCYKIEGWY